MVKVIFCDLDDTLLRPCTKEVLKEDEKAIERWILQGNRFVLATARHHSFLDKLHNYHYDFDCVGWNGAEIYKDHQIMKQYFFSFQEFLQIYQAMERYKINVKITNTNNEYIFGSLHQYTYQMFKDDPIKILDVNVDQYIQSQNLPIIHINYIFPTKNLHRQFYEDYQKKGLESLYSCKVTSDHSFDITKKEATKEKGIEIYLQLIEEPIELFATIGDSLNDIGMFKMSPWSFCMSHGHQEAKKNANYIVETVSQAIEILERK